MSKGTHKTKDGRTARKGLWYKIAMKKKRGEKMRSKGEKVLLQKKQLKEAKKLLRKANGRKPYKTNYR